MGKITQLLIAPVFFMLTQTAFAEFVPDDPTPYVSHKLEVIGAVKQPLTFTLEDLQKLPAQDALAVAQACVVDKDKMAARNYRGVLLRDLINQAEFKSDDPKGWKRAYIIARASDDYVALFSWNEIFNTATGDAVVVVFAAGDKPLADREGKIALVSGCDRRTGPRHVKWLTHIEVKLI